MKNLFQTYTLLFTMELRLVLVIYYLTLIRESLVFQRCMHQYIYIKIFILRAFQILKYLVALIFIRVHSPLFFGHFSTATFSCWVSRSWSLCHFSTVTFSHWVSRSWSLCHFSTATFSHWVSRSWSWHQKLCEVLQPDSPTYIVSDV